MERDVVHVMMENQTVLAWLAERLHSTGAQATRSLLFNEFARALGAHQAVVDETVIPALKSCHWRGLTSDVLVGHLALKRSLAELLTLQRGSVAFDDAFEGLMCELARERALEHGKLYPLLCECLDEDQRAMLAFDAEAHLTRLLGDTRPAEQMDLAQPLDELLEEAHVVLGSLPAADDSTVAS